MDSNKIIDALRQGVVTVVFEKIDTKEIRTMPCTLNQEIHKQSIDIKNTILLVIQLLCMH